MESVSQTLHTANPLMQLDLKTAYETQAFLHYYRSPSTSVHTLPLLLAVNEQAHPSKEAKIRQELDKFVSHLKKKQSAYNDEEGFLRFMFYKVHRKYLKHYTSYPSFIDLFNTGKYDCVTGTALYAYLLDNLGYTFSIKELKYHIYLEVHPLAGKNVSQQDYFLIESTDPQYGFLSKPEDIQKRLAWYDNEESAAQTSNYQYTFEINNTINLTELAGLSYYNSAIVYYNRQQFAKAISQLEKAEFLYASQRMQAFMALIGQTIASLPQSKLTR